MTRLRGMTWSHPRGYDPLVACARLWQQQTGVEITWDARSLQDFESYPVDELARRYDLIVIDHPHVGQVAREDCLLPLDRPERTEALAVLARQSVGPSFESYRWDDHLWALPIDAATQVQVWRRDRLDRSAATWDEVIALARNGLVLCPLRPPHCLMVFYSLAANLGHSCASGRDLIDTQFGIAVYDRLLALCTAIDPSCLEMDPIAVYERLAQPDCGFGCVPLIYGYVSYGCESFRPVRLAFADIPAAGKRGSVGTALGGTGIAVSRRSEQTAAALDFAFWVASAEVQRGPYAAAGGQPANAAAWDDPALDRAAGGFYRDTRATIEGAWLRPRHDGYMRFQETASARLEHALRARESGAGVIAELQRMFRDSFD